MEWLIDLLSPNNLSLASTILLYSFVIFAGIYLGKIKIFGVSLGVTFVLFVGILMGHLGYAVEGNTLHFLREFGLILFIFSPVRILAGKPPILRVIVPRIKIVQPCAFIIKPV